MEKNFLTSANRIYKVEEGSIAEELDIEVGDILKKINGRVVKDIIDYYYLLADDYVEVEIQKENGEVWVLEIDKEFDEYLGVEFDNPLMCKANHCSNKCVFCFIDQLPKGMRKTLYFKDDDSRLSFLQGNFVTLTNMKERDLERIVEYRISPLNVSIHTTDSNVRLKMLKNKNAGKIMENLTYLLENDIEVNGQIVLIPNLNDGLILEKTIRDLSTMKKRVNSLAIVPVGITRYREKLEKLEIFNKETAGKVIDDITRIQENLLKEIETRFVFLSDEFYIIAGRELPDYHDYENFIQLENGVGLIRKFQYEVDAALKTNWKKGKSTTIFTGTSAYEFIKEIAENISKTYHTKIDVIKVKNKFFGETITVAGLLTATDIINESKKHELNEQVLIPNVMLRTGEDIFLDDITLEEFEKRINRPVKVCKVEGHDLLNCILGGNDE